MRHSNELTRFSSAITGVCVLLIFMPYAGFFFAMSGAIFSHLTVGNGAKELFGPVLLVVLTGVSWYFRPENRKLSKEVLTSR
ncbi:MAG: hypothetical protein AB2L20_18265 [Mangrovibacterium sp.]